MKNRYLLLYVILFPFYIQAQPIWKNLGQPQGLVTPCSFYTDSKKLISCGLLDSDISISYPYVSPDLATNWERIFITNDKDKNINYWITVGTQKEYIKRDKLGNVIKGGTDLGDILYGYITVLDKDFNVKSNFYMTNRTFIWGFDISPENEIWIATNKGLLRSIDGNKSYQTVAFGNINTTAITFTDKGEIWVGTAEGIFKSVNQGKDWNKISSFYTETDILYFDRLSRQMLVINNTSTELGFFTKRGEVEYTRFAEDGRFIANHVFDNNYVYDMFRATETHLYMATQAGLWVSQDNGINFKKTSVSLPTYHFTKAENYLFAATINGLYRSSVVDTSWAKKGVAGLTITSLASSPSRLFANANTAGSGLYYSDDNGISWQENTTLSGRINTISALNSLVCANTSVGTWCSFDNGNIWKKTADNDGDLYLVSAKTWYMKNYNTVWRSKDQGATWVRLDIPTTTTFNKIIVPNETSVFASGLEGTFHSKDQGVTWEKLPICLSSCFIMENNRNGVLIMSNGWKTHYFSTDYGSSWQKFSIPINAVAEKIAISNTGQIAMATRDNIFLSVDFKTWLPSIDETSVLKGNYGEVISLHFDDKNFLYLGISGNSLHRSQMPISIVATEPDDLPKSITLSQNYPNPFNPSTTIHFSLPQASEIVLEVFDLLGKRVSLLEKGWQMAGTHQVQFDAKNLPSGTYVYRLQIGSKVISQKMTLVK